MPSSPSSSLYELAPFSYAPLMCIVRVSVCKQGIPAWISWQTYGHMACLSCSQSILCRCCARTTYADFLLPRFFLNAAKSAPVILLLGFAACAIFFCFPRNAISLLLLFLGAVAPVSCANTSALNQGSACIC